MNGMNDVIRRRNDRYYVRTAAGPRHFFDFSAGKLQRYIDEYGEDFWLVLLGTTDSPLDVYVIPFPAIRDMLTPASLANDYGGRAPRWTGKIENAWWLRIDRGSRRLDLRPYYTTWSGE